MNLFIYLFVCLYVSLFIELSVLSTSPSLAGGPRAGGMWGGREGQREPQQRSVDHFYSFIKIMQIFRLQEVRTRDQHESGGGAGREEEGLNGAGSGRRRAHTGGSVGGDVVGNLPHFYLI